MCDLPTLTVQRDEDRVDAFLVSLNGFHYRGEGRLVTRSQLAELLGSGAAAIIVDQLDELAKQEAA